MRVDVDRDDPPTAEQVEQGGEVEGAAAVKRPRLDEQVRTRLVDDLLVDPEVERALADTDAAPAGVGPSSAAQAGISRQL